MGTARNICVVGSGGVKMAPRIKAPTMAYFLYLRIKAGDKIPNFERIRLNIGNSKTTPKTTINRIKNPI